MFRIAFLFIAVTALVGVSAFAGDIKNDPCSYPGYKDGACPPNQDPGDKNPDHPGKPNVPPVHPGNPGHPGHGFPGHGGNQSDCLCAGGFEGYYYGQPFPVAFFVQDNGFGQLSVQSWFRGGSWFGRGVCRQINSFQAAFELYFMGAPVHRGLISRNQFGAIVMEGQLDFNGPFQLQRTR